MQRMRQQQRLQRKARRQLPPEREVSQGKGTEGNGSEEKGMASVSGLRQGGWRLLVFPAVLCLLLAVLPPGEAEAAGRTGSTSSGYGRGKIAAAAGGKTASNAGGKSTDLAVAGSRKVIFLGDSRTVGMYDAVTGSVEEQRVNTADSAGDLWSARTSEGILWLKKTGVPQIEKQIDASTDIVICSGVNDEYRSDFVEVYTEYINQKAAEWLKAGARTYFVSVLPIRKDEGLFTNRGIRKNNQALINGFTQQVTYIDLDTPFQGFLQYQDNLHFQEITSRMLYEYIKLTLQQDHPAE